VEVIQVSDERFASKLFVLACTEAQAHLSNDKHLLISIDKIHMEFCRLLPKTFDILLAIAINRMADFCPQH
jgi:hypothetical protein